MWMECVKSNKLTLFYFLTLFAEFKIQYGKLFKLVQKSFLLKDNAFFLQPKDVFGIFEIDRRYKNQIKIHRKCPPYYFGHCDFMM